MTDVSVWRLLAYMDDDGEGEHDESRTLAEWQLQDTLRWCVTRGYDNVYLCRIPGESVRFSRAESAPVIHHMHVEGSRDERATEPGAA